MGGGVEVVRFVQEQEHDGKRPPWRALVARWNEEHRSARPFDGHQAARNVQRDYNRALRALVLPEYEVFSRLRQDRFPVTRPPDPATETEPYWELASATDLTAKLTAKTADGHGTQRTG